MKPQARDAIAEAADGVRVARTMYAIKRDEETLQALLAALEAFQKVMADAEAGHAAAVEAVRKEIGA